MSASPEEIKMNSKKQWDVSTVFIKPGNNLTWGIKFENTKNALKILKLIEPDADINASKINFKQIRLLLSYLHNNNPGLTDINSAIENFAEIHEFLDIPDNTEKVKKIYVIVKDNQISDTSITITFQYTYSVTEVNEEQSIVVQKRLIEDFINERSLISKWSLNDSRVITKLLFPLEFTKLLYTQTNIIWIVDSITAPYPWELLQDTANNSKPICLNGPMIRQVTTFDYRLNFNTTTKSSALIIGDPYLNGFLNQLPGASIEAKTVSDLLIKYNYETTILIQIIAAEIIKAFFTSDYKILHIAGHGIFDEDPSKPHGILIGHDIYITEKELSQMNTIPELIFVNCGYLGKIENIGEGVYGNRNKLAADLGIQFLKIGAKAVVVSGWAIDDSAAIEFTREFYNNMLEGDNFGNAIFKARKLVYSNYKDNNTWGAFQCYGDNFYKLINEKNVTNVERVAIQKGEKDQESIDKVIQIKLRSLFSLNTSGPFTIIADGKWGPASEGALQYIINTYNFVPKERDEALFQCLENISQKIVRVSCNDDWLLTKAEHNPFSIIDNTTEELELRHIGNGASVFEKHQNRELAHFHRFVVADKSGGEHFTRFSAWLMLLRMGSMNYEKVSRLSIKQNENWIPLEHLENKSDIDFMLPPDYFMNSPDFMAQCRVLFSSPTEEQIDIFGIYFSGDFRFSIIEGYLFEPPEGMDGKVKYFDDEYFFRDIDYLTNKEAPAQALHRADYLKIFVVKKNIFDDIAREFTSKSIPAGDFDPKLYKLMTTPQSDFYATYTIGLNLNKKDKEKPLPFNNRWVLIAATSNSNLNPKEVLLPNAIGSLLANRGFGIVCGGWFGIDEAIASTFTKYLIENNISDKDRLVQLLVKGQKSVFIYGKIEITKEGSNWYIEALKRVNALLIIGGKGESNFAFEEAQRNSISVIPVPGTGGDAQRIFTKLLSEKEIPYSRELLLGLDKKIDTVNDAEQIAMHVINILNEFKATVKKPFSELEFKSIVSEIYKNTKITVADDLQKSRWGGKPENNRKRLKASVTKSKIPGIYNIELNVQSSDSSKLDGRVAFFLHSTFSDEIRYEIFTKGIAQLKISGYEAFTVGAFTEDETMLELDLNDVTGFPTGFYYSDISDSFKNTVKKMYENKRVFVKDDLQKNRWGGKSISNGKQIRAVVTNSLLPGHFKVSLEVLSENQKTPLVGDVAFFIHDTYPYEIKYRKAKEGIAKINLTAYDAFTVGAYTQDGTMLELDLQNQKGYPKQFYYKVDKIGSDGFYTSKGISDIVDKEASTVDKKDKTKKVLLIFTPIDQRTWLVATTQKVYILLDDDQTKKENKLIMTSFDKNKILPIKFKTADGEGAIKFNAQETWWYYSLSLYPNTENLKKAIEELIGI